VSVRVGGPPADSIQPPSIFFTQPQTTWGDVEDHNTYNNLYGAQALNDGARAPYNSNIERTTKRPNFFTVAPPFVRFAGQVTSKDLGLKAPPAAVTRQWPLHIKEVTLVDTKKVLQLPGVPPQLVEELREELRWLWDVTKYAAVPVISGNQWANAPSCRAFPTSDAQTMMQADRWAFVGNRYTVTSDGALGNTFWLAEPTKIPPRRRVITESATNWAGCRPSYNIKYGTRRARHLRVMRRVGARRPGSVFGTIQVDMAGWFDQFRLHPDVQQWFRLIVGNDIYNLTRMPMGANWAPSVAQRTTWALIAAARYRAGPAGLRTSADSCIDNVRFVGEQTDVVAVATAFVEICKEVGVTLNEVDVNSSETELCARVAELFTTRATWLGEDYNYVDETVSCTTATLEKLAVARAGFCTVRSTCRNFAAIVSLALWADGTVLNGDGWHRRARLWRAYARCAATCGDEGAASWDQQLAGRLTGEALEELDEWLNEIFTAPPRKITRDAPLPPTKILYVDSSAAGWGSVCLSERKIETACGFFSEQIAHSASAEPAGIRAAVARWINPQDNERVLVVTDHAALVWVASAHVQLSHSDSTNAMLASLACYSSRFIFSWRPGATFVADAMSRQLASSITDDQRRTVLDDWRKAQQRPLEWHRKVGAWQLSTQENIGEGSKGDGQWTNLRSAGASDDHPTNQFHDEMFGSSVLLNDP
jgi:hypothetical protein